MGKISATKNIFPVSATTTRVRSVISPLEQSNTGAQSTNHTAKLIGFQKQNCKSFGQQFPIKKIK